MILDFSFEEVMRLSNLKRWGIVEMSRSQSVAEHSYNVAMIAVHIVDRLENVSSDKTSLRSVVMGWSLAHDLPEVVTGDIPTPLKEMMGDALGPAEGKLFPQYITYKKLLATISESHLQGG